MNTPAYDQLLATSSIAHLSPADAVIFLGMLVDLADRQQDERGARHAIALGEALAVETWPSVVRASYYYTLANAWDDLRKRQADTLPQAWNWTNEAFDRSLLALRQARNEPEFDDVPKERRCQILTNLGNSLSGIGRSIEALDAWNEALAIDPEFPMALVNRAYGLFHYAKGLYDEGHREAFLHIAHHDFQLAIDRIPYPDAKAYYTRIMDAIASRFPPGQLDVPHQFRTFSLGETGEEVAYRTWSLEQRLFLNPLNDVTTETVAAADVLLTPSMVVPTGEPPILQGFFNQLKQEYVAARFLLHQGLHGLAPRYSDRDVPLWDTLDYPSYGLNLELVKLAYRSFYSLFDKTAYFLNRYLQLGIRERRVSFSTLWYDKEERKKPLRELFRERMNLPLRGLYWISRDMDDAQERQLTDAALLSTIRNHLEHKYLKTHQPEWVIAKDDPLRRDILAYSLERDVLERKALRMARLARAALLYLTLSIHIEEEERRGSRKGRVMPMTLGLFDEDWKR